jgi:uncharacterized repeat protein (TIGR01451 family)
VTKTASAATVLSGAPLTYSIEVRNAGSAGASAVHMVDTPNVNFTYTGFATSRGTCNVIGSLTGGTLDCDVGDLGTGAGAFASITVTGHITAVADVFVKNMAAADPGSTVAESNEGNNTDSVTVHALASGFPGTFTQGDVDDDGDIDSVDALWILWLEADIVDSVPVPPAADVDKNGAIDVIDALLILQIEAGF